MSYSKKYLIPGAHQSIIHSNRDLGDQGPFDHVFLLLHGYSERGEKMMKRLGKRLETMATKTNQKLLILAPNGFYPMPKSFPLDGRPISDDLLQGFAWYFYDQAKDKFLIDYEVPALTLANLLKEHNPNKVPTTIIGYSQGGYLAPFVGLAFEHTTHVIGLNCSFRTELFSTLPSFRLDQIQGQKDTIIDTALCSQRFEKLKEQGIKGDFHWLPNDDHRLSPEISEKTLTLIQNA
jgi:predicted esterase